MKLDPYLTLTSKWIKDLNVRNKTTKLLKENRGNLHDFGFGNDLLDMTPKTKEKNFLTKFKTFVH